MPALTSKFKSWRKLVRERLRDQGKIEDFRRVQQRIYMRHIRAGRCNKIATRKSWEQAHDEFYPVVDKKEFDRLWGQRLKNLRRGRALKKEQAIGRRLPNNKKEWISAIARQKRALAQAEREETQLARAKAQAERDAAKAKKDRAMAEKREAAAKAMEQELARDRLPDVQVEDDGPLDVARDARWVYQNMANLFKRNQHGIEYLDEEALKAAPSNGAIGMAHYALNDRKAFFDKFVVKILNDAPGSTPEETEEEAKSSLDPSFDDLEKYINRNGG